jgi:hypothetical protein
MLFPLEHIMTPKSQRQSSPLAKGALLTLDAARPVEIGCQSGQLWITQDNDVRDVVLSPGERFVSDRAGTVLVHALSNAVLSTAVLPGAPAATSFWTAIANHFRGSPSRRLATS